MRQKIALILLLPALLLFFTACGGGGGGGGGTDAKAPVTTTPTTPIVDIVPTTTTTTTTTSTTTTTVPAGPYTFGGGQGTLAQPYLVQNATDVNHIRDFPAAYYWVNNDINMNGLNFAPIPTFSGVVYGNNHTLNNFNIVYTGAGKAAFAQTLSGTFVQLKLDGGGGLLPADSGNISGPTYAAIFAGDMTSTGMISSCLAHNFTVTSPLGGNGYNTGIGQIPYVTKVAGSYTSGTSISAITFNGSFHNSRSY